MAVGYKYREINNFPEIKEGVHWASTAQLTMLDVHDNSIEAHSRITRLGRSEHEHYDRYSVEHEVVRKLKWRFQDHVRRELLAIEEFSIYLAKDRSHMLAATKDDLCNDLLRRIQINESAFAFAGRTVDLVRMRQELQMKVRGGYFSKLKIADVTAAAIFGTNVSESADWNRYETSGEISALTLEMRWEDMTTSVQVSNTSGVVIYQSLSEKDQLDLVSVTNAMVGPYADTPNRSW